MVKEDRSDWVAVAPEISASSSTPSIRPAATAYQLFQKDITPQVRDEFRASQGTFDVGQFSRAVRDRWVALDAGRKAHYEDLARQDGTRFAQESHAADVAALERRRQLQEQREELILEDDNGDLGRRSTRGARVKLQRKKERREKKRLAAAAARQDHSESDSDEESEDISYDESSDESSDDSDRPNKKKPAAPRQVSESMLRQRERARAQKEEKEHYIAQRQEDLRKDRAAQAKRRLDFLLQQSDIFSHFGQVEEDKARYGTKTMSSPRAEDGTSRRRASMVESNVDTDDVDAADFDEEAEQSTTYLSAQPSTIGEGKMRDYQLEGLNWMIRLQENGVNGILADEMGLGKTLQSISMLVYMMEYQKLNGPHLIVVPKSTMSNWMNELKRWAPTLTAVKFHGSKEEREQLRREVIEPAQRDENRTWNVCVTTYEVCNIDKHVFNKFAWSYLIIDEAHRLKNEASAFSQTIRTFETRYRLLLTGTPLQNNLHELWALLNFLVPDVFASAEQFDEWFNLDIDDADEKNKLISQLHKILRPFMLRRLKADVETSLPPKHETILFIGMSAMQKKLYKDILLRDIDVVQGSGSGSGSRTAILNIVMQLRKCAGHPYLFPGVEDRSLPPLGDHLIENSGKMVLLDKLLRRLKERGHRVLLFTQMTRILDILEDYMVYRHYKYCRIDGNTSYEVREEHIDAFNAPDSEKFIFLLSTRAGGLGINLQTADVVILFDSDWNPQADLQAQDRAHRIGQKREVQVFRFVTEHTVEEKIVERAQQKLKLDAMVVQSGRLKEKDKLSSSDLLEAVRFGADKVFKSKDSSITEDDIDMILDFGKRKTQELNEKLQNADKGDLLDFKLDAGASVQTFEGVDYSGNALARAAQAELLGIMDIGKRERKTVANYNENELYQQQIAALQGRKKERKKKEVRLPKAMRLPRIEQWQMFDRVALQKLQEEEEKAFRSLPEEQQKMASMKYTVDELTAEQAESKLIAEPLPPLLEEEKLARKQELLAEGFSEWDKTDYLAFIKGSAKHGRHNMEKIAKQVGKPQSVVERYALAFWDANIGKKRFPEHEYDRVVKLIERGEKKMEEIKGLERGTRSLLSLFENPWVELEFIHTNCKDKMFTLHEDRHLLCWTHKYGYGQWEAIKMAIRRSPNFRFDYFLRSLPADLIGRRCEQLMKAAEKEVEQLEAKVREDEVLSSEKDKAEAGHEDGNPPLATVEIPMYKVLRAQRRVAAQIEEEAERRNLEGKVKEIEDQMRRIQEQLKALNESRRDSVNAPVVSAEFPDELIPALADLVSRSGSSNIVSIANAFASDYQGQVSKNKVCAKITELAVKEKRAEDGDTKPEWHMRSEFMHLLDADTVRYLQEQKEAKLSKLDEAEKLLDDTAKQSEVTQGAVAEEDGAVGAEGVFVPFPEYDGTEPPKESKRAFTHFCNGTRRAVKKSLDPVERKDKNKVNSILKEQWLKLSAEEKKTWKAWEKWDAKRYERDLAVFNRAQKVVEVGQKRRKENQDVDMELPVHVPKKKRLANS